MGPLFGQDKDPSLINKSGSNSSKLSNDHVQSTKGESSRETGMTNLFQKPGQNPGVSSSKALKKYLVLLQDSLAIKFVPLNGNGNYSPVCTNCHSSHVKTITSPPHCFKEPSLRNPTNCGNCLAKSSANCGSGPNKLHRRDRDGNEQEGYSRSSSRQTEKTKAASADNYNNKGADLPGSCNCSRTLNCNNPSSSGQWLNSGSGSNCCNNVRDDNNGPLMNHPQQYDGQSTQPHPVDHSLHGLYLYKGFLDSNAECYWNVGLTETFQNLDYKGYIVPSTILITAFPRFLMILRTAWERQMLRSPPGYAIQFIGEIDELIADPIRQGQFAPLADSLCWAILELTSVGEEAFVDSLLLKLKVAFPGMSSPARELVYQTLEKLIRDRKIYQTPRGYFVVTPETWRLMSNLPPSRPHPFHIYPYNNHEYTFNNYQLALLQQQSHGTCTRTLLLGQETRPLTLDALMTSQNNSNHYDSDGDKYWKECWDDRNPEGDHTLPRNPGGFAPISTHNHPPLKRHNSLKTFRQRDLPTLTKDKEEEEPLGSSSLKLSKSKSCDELSDGDKELPLGEPKGRRSTLNHIGTVLRNLKLTNGSGGGQRTDLERERSRKSKSLLSRIFQFGRRPRSKTRGLSSSPSSPVTKPKSRGVRSSSVNGRTTGTTTTTSRETQTSCSTEPLATPSSRLPAVNFTQNEPAVSQPLSVNPVNKQQFINTPEERQALDAAIRHGDNDNGDQIIHLSSSSSTSSSPDDRLNEPDRNKSSTRNHPDTDRWTLASSPSQSQGHSPIYELLTPSGPRSVSPHNLHQEVTRNSEGHGHVQTSDSRFPLPSPGLGPPPNFPSFHRGDSSRCSTLSQAPSSISLGYGSQGYPSMNYSSLGSYYNQNQSNNHNPHAFSGNGNINSSRNNPIQSPNPLVNHLEGEFTSQFTPSSPLERVYSQNQVQDPQSHGSTTPTKPPAAFPNGPKNSVEFYRRLYPKYGNSFSRSSPHYSSLNLGSAPKFTSKSTKRGVVDDLDVPKDNSSKGTPSNGITTHSNQTFKEVNATVTQNLKSTTNMELELLLPLGNIMKAALNAKKQALKEQFFRDEYNQSPPPQKKNPSEGTNNVNKEDVKRTLLEVPGMKVRIGEPSTTTEVRTTVDNNGLVQTRFETLPGEIHNLKSTIEIMAPDHKTNPPIIINRNNSKDKDDAVRGKDKKLVNKSGKIKVTDLGRDSKEDLIFA